MDPVFEGGVENGDAANTLVADTTGVSSGVEFWSELLVDITLVSFCFSQAFVFNSSKQKFLFEGLPTVCDERSFLFLQCCLRTQLTENNG